MDVSQLSAVARRAAQSRDWSTVGSYAERILRAAPDDPEGFFLRGLAEKGTSRYLPAIASLEKTLELDASRYDAAIELAGLYATMLRYSEAVALQREYEGNLSNSPRYLHMAASTYSILGLHEAALPLYEKANELQPGLDLFEASLASCYVFAGKIQEAVSLYEGLLHRHPNHQRNHYELGRLATATNDAHVEQMKGILRSTDLPAEKNIFLYYAIGKELEDLEQWDEAFRYFKLAGDAVKTVAQYDVNKDVALIDKVIEVCNADWLSDRPENVEDSRTPIFIVGLPRSGTTLTERIISSHSDVESIDETYSLQTVLRQRSGVVSTNVMSEAMLEAAAGADVRAIAKSYFELVGHKLGAAPMFVEKFPENFLYLGFIAKAFPKARIIHQKRAPMDTCFAMYKQSFFRYAYALEDLAAYYIAYERLARHWRDVIGERIIEVQYESLVTAQEEETHRLLEELGLPFEQACIDFEQNPAASATASAVEVRQKVHTRSIGKWRKFEKHLKPLTARLEDAGIPVE